MDNGNILASNAGSIARLLAGVLGGILTSVGISADDGALETIIGGILVAVAGIWAIVKNAKAVKETAKKAGVLVLLLAFGWMLTGCAVINGSAGDSNYMGFAFGEKASSTLAGLNITETKTEAGNVVLERGVGVDQSGVTGEADVGKLLGNLLLLGLQSQGVPVKAQAIAVEQPGASQEPTTAIVPATLPIASTPKSAISGEGVPLVAILGNRATCPRCVALWDTLDAAALSESLCGASVIDADKTDNPVEYARLRPQSAFAYPLVVVYDAAGKLAGQFDARGMTQAQIAAKVKALVPACASQ